MIIAETSDTELRIRTPEEVGDTFETILSRYSPEPISPSARSSTFVADRKAQLIAEFPSREDQMTQARLRMTYYRADRPALENAYYEQGNIGMLASWIKITRGMLPIAETGWLLADGMERFLHEHDRIAGKSGQSRDEHLKMVGYNQMQSDAQRLKEILPLRISTFPSRLDSYSFPQTNVTRIRSRSRSTAKVH